MKKISSLLFASIVFANAALAQVKCPTINLSSSTTVKEGQTASFTANLSGGEANAAYTYNWTISNGSISSGQGTYSIVIDTKGLGGQSCTATLELGGTNSRCNNNTSATIYIDAVPKTAMQTNGNFSTTNLFTEAVNNFAVEFMNAWYGDESTKAVIILYPAKNKTAAEAISQMTSAVKKSFAPLNLKPGTYKIITGGNRPQTSYEMFIVPKGGEMPLATPAQ